MWILELLQTRGNFLRSKMTMAKIHISESMLYKLSLKITTK